MLLVLELCAPGHIIHVHVIRERWRVSIHVSGLVVQRLCPKLLIRDGEPGTIYG